MNPGLVVKLRPSGPWRIGPDSGARNRVDEIYHSDTLYSAVSAAMSRLGMLEEWLEATARAAEPAVCFSSCYPFMDEIDHVVPPRTIWPPTGPGVQARVRWKSARFVPVEIVRAILAGKKIDQDRWVVDGPSECLVPAGRPGPFRTAVRWSAAVDRLSGSSERHSTACTEFRHGAGLWAVVSFPDDAARDRWQEPVKAAFRLLADTGFGGERSRGWGRSESPEFIEGSLPDLVLPEVKRRPERKEEPKPPVQVSEPQPEKPAPAPEHPVQEPEPEGQPPAGEPPAADPPIGEPSEGPAAEAAVVAPAESAELRSGSETAPEANQEQTPRVEPPTESVSSGSEIVSGPGAEPHPPYAVEEKHPAGEGVPHWLLSVFAPGSRDVVDWKRGDYALLTRGGRVESPAGSGQPKKLMHMVAEGSVVVAAQNPRGAAVNVAPEGFPHPVYRAGFAVAIPLPEDR